MVGVLTLRLEDKHHRQTSGGMLLTSGFGAPLLYDDLLPIAGKRAAGGAFRLDWVPWVSKMTASRAFGAPVEILVSSQVKAVFLCSGRPPRRVDVDGRPGLRQQKERP